jgi:hypothetical protein
VTDRRLAARCTLATPDPSVIDIHLEARENWGTMIGAQIETLVVTATRTARAPSSREVQRAHLE